MKTLITIIACAAIISCSTNPAATPAGSAVIAKVGNAVIDKQLDAAATKIDTGNPYVHALATGLRENMGTIISQADVQRIAADYGDPNNQHKFKQLALDIWQAIAGAAARVGWSSAIALAADGLNKGATDKVPTTGNGP